MLTVARIGSAGTLMSLWITHPRYFPTLFSATSIGISNIFARMATIFAPLIVEEGEKEAIKYMFILACYAYSCSVYVNYGHDWCFEKKKPE